ncbi:MAG: hypothetical protein Q9198_011376, partial [Flavoplaca austrocitrina]
LSAHPIWVGRHSLGEFGCRRVQNHQHPAIVACYRINRRISNEERISEYVPANSRPPLARPPAIVGLTQ